MAIRYSTQMAGLVANAGGAIQSIPPVTVNGGRKRSIVATVPLAAAAIGTTIMIARLPLFCTVTGFTVLNSVSLGSSTIEIGDANTPALFAAAATYTAVDTPTEVGLTSALGTIITTGYDATSGNQVTYASPGEGGGLYEDVILTVGAAALPGAGQMVVLVEYVID